MKRILTAVLLIAAFAAPAHARMTPLPAQVFCLNNPAVCRGGGADRIVLTDDALATLEAINVSVNRAIRPRAETIDVWSLNPAAGDCEDYALTKRAVLINAGWPPNALRLASGNGHILLLVVTDMGVLALDNRYNSVMLHTETDIEITAVSSGDLTRWSAP